MALLYIHVHESRLRIFPAFTLQQVLRDDTTLSRRGRRLLNSRFTCPCVFVPIDVRALAYRLDTTLVLLVLFVEYGSSLVLQDCPVSCRTHTAVEPIWVHLTRSAASNVRELQILCLELMNVVLSSSQLHHCDSVRRDSSTSCRWHAGARPEIHVK